MSLRRTAVAGVLAATLLVAAACTGHRAKADDGAAADVPPDGASVTVGQFTIAMPAGTVATTTRVSIRAVRISPSPNASTVLQPVTGQVDVSLDKGVQPGQPVTITAKPTAAVEAGTSNLMLLSRDGRTQRWTLTPATFDAQKDLLSATADHFSVFGFVHLDLTVPLHRMLDLFKTMFELDGAAKPSCAGKALKSGDVTYALDKRYQGAGDGIIWPCLADGGDGKVELSLANATGLPWLIRSRPSATVTDRGTVDVNKAVLMAFYHQFLDGGRFSQSMVLPGVTKKYIFDGAALPGYVDLQLDGFAQQAMALIWALRFVLDLFDHDADVVKKLGDTDFIGCLSDLVESQTAGFTATGAGLFAKAFFDCAGPIAGDVILGALASGVSLVLNDLVAAYRTAAGHDRTRVVVGRTTARLALTAQGVGPLAFGSSGSSAEALLAAAFGPADRVSDGPFCELGGGDPGRLRRLTWGTLSVTLQGEHLHGGGLKLTSWQVGRGRLTAPVTLPHGMAPGATYDDLIGNAPGAHHEDWIGGETEMLDGDGIQYFFEAEPPSGTTPIDSIGDGIVPCE